MAQSNSGSGLTLTVLGSGTMGTAIMGGIMSSLIQLRESKDKPEDLPARLPEKFVACDAWPPAEQKVHAALDKYGFPLTTYTNQNVKGVEAADVILLACKPYGFKDILTEPGMKEALKGKTLMSILAGVNAEQIEDALYGDDTTTAPEDRCSIVRVMPSTASLVRESMTVIATRNPPVPADKLAVVSWIFSRIGKVAHLPSSNMDAATALCGSGPAFVAIILEAMADGAVSMGIPRAEAQTMAAQTMRGAAQLVLNGEHPAVLKDKVSTPGGCTIGGLMVMEENNVRGSVAKAIREATNVASKLGEGSTSKNVNAPRW